MYKTISKQFYHSNCETKYGYIRTNLGDICAFRKTHLAKDAAMLTVGPHTRHFLEFWLVGIWRPFFVQSGSGIFTHAPARNQGRPKQATVQFSTACQNGKAWRIKRYFPVCFSHYCRNTFLSLKSFDCVYFFLPVEGNNNQGSLSKMGESNLKKEMWS